MKKITWLFTSLMLFLGLGTASAQTLPDPTFTPMQEGISPATATPGQEIVFTLPSSINLENYMGGGIFILYNFYDEEPDNDPKYTISMTDYYAWMGYFHDGGPKPAVDYEAGYIDGVGIVAKVTVPADAKGGRWFYARLAAFEEDDDAGYVAVYSDVVSATYVIEGEAEELSMPTFSPASGTEVPAGAEVTISATNGDAIYYVIDGKDADLTLENIRANKCEDYLKPIKIYKAQTIKAVNVEMGMMGPANVSAVATATYTVQGGDVERTDVPKLTVTPTGIISIKGSAVFSCTLDPQTYTHASGKVGFGLSLKNGDDVTKLEFQVGATVDPEAWTAYADQALNTLKGASNPTLAAIPTNKSGSGGRDITIEAKTVHYRLTLAAGATKEPEIVFSAVEVNNYGNWPSTDVEILATESVKFAIQPEPIMPDQTYIKFTPYPKANLPENIAKGTSESVFLRPVNKEDTVYYRILSVDGADQNAPISKEDTKVEKKNFNGVQDYEPINLTEDLVNAKGQFVVKAAAWILETGEWSPNVIAAYDVVFGEHVSATELAFVSGQPTEFMVGETYEMKLSLTAPADSLALHGNKNVNLIINWEGGIDFADVAYKFAEDEDWTSVDKDDLTDLIRIPNTFKNFAEKGAWVKMTMSRKKRGDDMWMMMAIAQGYSFLDAKTLSSVIDLTLPCVGRPAAEPAFSPEPGYIAKGSAVTITCATDNTSIYYTTDGTEPTATTGTLYENPVTINGTTTLKAVAVTADGGTSFVSEGAYSVIGVPQITPKPAPYTGFAIYDSLVEITLNPATEGASIYYTTDGTEPSATNGTLYTGRFPLRASVLKVIAVKGEDVSPVVTVEYNLRPIAPTATPAPVRVNNKPVPVPFGTKVKLECAMKEAQIYWRIGGNSAVTANDNLYTEEIELKEASTILKAVAIYNGVESQQVSFTYTVMLAEPEFSIPEGKVDSGVRVTLSSKSIEANTNPNKQINIAYTTDGSDPDRNSTKYTGPIEIKETVTIKAITWTVWTQGLEVSTISSATYTVGEDPVVEEKDTLPMPKFNPVGGEVEKGTAVVLSCDTANTKIYYSINADTVTVNSLEYTTAISIDSAMTIKAIAVKEGFVNSPVASAAYTIKGEDPVVEEKDTLPMPKFNPVGGEVEKGTAVVLSCDTANAKIYYSINADTVTENSLEYTTAIVIDTAMTIKAIAVKDGFVNSPVASAAYTVKSEDPVDPTANEGKELAGVNVYPNPNSGMFYIELPVAATVDVFASNGVLVKSFTAPAGKATLSLDHSGIYFVRVASEGRATVKRVIVR